MSYNIRPKQHQLREASQKIEGVLNSCRYVLDKDKNLSINLGYIDKEFAGDFGVFGNARDSKSANIYFNTAVEGWEKNLEELTADVYGQSWFYENSEINFNWQQLLASITGLLLIEKTSDKKEIDDNKKLGSEWREKKESLSQQASEDAYVEFSWELKVKIGRELLERQDLKDFPKLEKSDVLDAGDKILEL